MNRIGQVGVIRRPPLLPGPVRNAEIGLRDKIHTSAKEAGYSDLTSPSQHETASLNDRKNAALVRYFVRWTLDDDDMIALLTPAMQEHLARYRQTRDEWVRGFGKDFSILGSETQKHHFARFVIGHVTMHDFEVKLHNLQVDVAHHTFPFEGENAAVTSIRIDRLVALRCAFMLSRREIVARLDEALEEVRQLELDRVDRRDWEENIGMWQDPAYKLHLQTERARFASMRLWPQFQDRLEIPISRQTYSEKFTLTGKGYMEFWQPKLEARGVLEGIYFGFRKVLWLPGCVLNDACKDFMILLAANAAHYTWLRQGWKQVENECLQQRDVKSSTGHTCQWKIDYKDSFDYIRKVAEKMPLSWDDIMVRMGKVGPGAQKRSRGEAVEFEKPSPSKKKKILTRRDWP